MSAESPGVTPTAAAASLRGLCGGAVVLPGDSAYDAARAAWDLAVDQRPAAIAYPADATEVAAVVRAAGRAGLRIAAQGTGHNAGPLAALHDVVLLRTSGMIRVRVDAEARRARVQAGARWLDTVEAAAPYGLTALHSSSPTVGVVGYSLGGGIGWYARAHGQQANAVTAVELVTAGGEAVRVDADHDPDLFWALRGGGGNFGVVTALEFALYPIPGSYAGMLAWDWRQTAPVLARWVRWANDCPDQVTTSFRIQQIPSDDEFPAHLRGRRLAVIEGAVLSDDRPAQRLLAPLRALRPEFDTFAATPAASVVTLPPDPRRPVAVVTDSALLSALPDEAVDAVVAAAGPDSESTLRLVELRQLGGALSRADPDAGALPVLNGRFLLFASTTAQGPGDRARGLATARRVVAAVAPYATGSAYLNFATTAVEVSAGYDPHTWTRLRAIRATVDPGQALLANHPVPPAEPGVEDRPAGQPRF